MNNGAACGMRLLSGICDLGEQRFCGFSVGCLGLYEVRVESIYILLALFWLLENKSGQSNNAMRLNVRHRVFYLGPLVNALMFSFQKFSMMVWFLPCILFPTIGAVKIEFKWVRCAWNIAYSLVRPLRILAVCQCSVVGGKR